MLWPPGMVAAVQAVTIGVAETLSGLEPLFWLIGEFGVIILVFILIISGKLVPVRSVREREILWEARLKEMSAVMDAWKTAYAHQERIHEHHVKVLDDILKGVEMSTDTIESLREIQEGP